MNLAQTTSVILAGGLGTRLSSVVSDRPKVLAPICGKPFLGYILDQLSELGIKNVVLCTGYLGDMIQEYFGHHYKSIQLAYSKEQEPLGTAGALRLAEPLFKSEDILVMNGDSYCEADISGFIAWHVQRKSDASLLLTYVQDTSRYGQVKFLESGKLTCFMEKSSKFCPGWINAGVYLLSEKFTSSLPSGRSVSLEHEIFPKWIGGNINGYRSEGDFLDIGTPEDFIRAERFFREKLDSRSKLN